MEEVHTSLSLKNKEYHAANVVNRSRLLAIIITETDGQAHKGKKAERFSKLEIS